MKNEHEFALRLAKLRTKKNVSAREMSLSIGQNPGYINHIELGQATPSLSGIFYICEYLGVTPAEFFSEEIENPARLRSVTELLATLNDEELAMIENLIKKIKK